MINPFARVNQIELDNKQLKAKAEFLQKEVEELKNFIGTYIKLSYSEPEIVPKKLPTKYKPRGPRQNPPLKIMKDLFIEILQTEDRSMFISELHKEIKRRGISINGRNPRSTLTTMLWRLREQIGMVKTLDVNGRWEGRYFLLNGSKQ